MDPLSRFEKVEKISEGGMGVVYRAWDPQLNRPVAIKFVRLSPNSTAKERAEFEARLKREAQAAGTLSHPHIATIYDLIQQEDRAYIVMEYVDGQSLQAWIAEGDALGPFVVLDIVRQAAMALDHAHSKGVVHRDIKPSNILLSCDGAVKLVDFGLAKIAAAASLTQKGSAVGTPEYMPPEQIEGAGVRPESDQYSLAVCAFEMITGARLFVGESIANLFHQILNSPPPAASQLNDSLGPEVDAVLAQALARVPEQRFKTCLEFSAALERACATCKNWRPKSAPLPVRPVRKEATGGVAVATATPMPTPAELEKVIAGLDPWLTEAIIPKSTPRSSPSASSPSPASMPQPEPVKAAPIVAPHPPKPGPRRGLLAAVGVLLAVLSLGVWYWLSPAKQSPAAQTLQPTVLPAQPREISAPAPAAPQPVKPTVAKTPATRPNRQPKPKVQAEPKVPVDINSKPVKLALPANK